MINVLTISGSLRAHSSKSVCCSGLLHSLLRVIASRHIVDSVQGHGHIDSVLTIILLKASRNKKEQIGD